MKRSLFAESYGVKMLRKELLLELQRYVPFNQTEEAYLEKLLHFIRTQKFIFSKNNFAGHITASAIVIDRTSSNMLLIWHEKTGKWLQPGGHCEPNLDSTLQATALRELCEETTLIPDLISVKIQGFFDIDLHLIPQRDDNPTHFHYDFRYLFIYRLPMITGDYGHSQKWIAIKEIMSSDNTALVRVAMKLLAMTTLE